MIQAVLEKGKRLKGSSLSLLVLKKSKLGCSQIGLVIPTRYDKRATKRNRLKRKLREILNKKITFLKKGMSLIVMAHKSALKKETIVLEKELEDLLKKAELLR